MSSFEPLQAAENAIRRKLGAEGFQGKLEYEAGKVIENDRWWYIPFYWIGCAGFIVNKDDLYVNWLGSGMPLELCFWGHDRGVLNDVVDFEFCVGTDTELAKRLFRKFKHMRPNAKGKLPSCSVPYLESEISSMFLSQFPMFKRHNVWIAIPELLEACQNEGLQFTCFLSKTP